VTEKARDGDDRRTFLDGQRRGGVAQVVWRDFQSQRLDRGIENVASPVTVAQRCAFLGRKYQSIWVALCLVVCELADTIAGIGTVRAWWSLTGDNSPRGASSEYARTTRRVGPCRSTSDHRSAASSPTAARRRSLVVRLRCLGEPHSASGQLDLLPSIATVVDSALPVG
jgi:hypothetical protein